MAILIKAEELKGLISIPEAVAAVRAGFRDQGEKPAYSAPRIRIQHEDRPIVERRQGRGVGALDFFGPRCQGRNEYGDSQEIRSSPNGRDSPWPAATLNSDVVGYVWDTTAPVGSVVTSAKAPNVKIIVVESGTAQVGSWVHYQRNVHDDYVTLFKTRPPRVGMVAFMTDANDTSSAAEAWMGEVQFAPRALDGRKSPTSMLR